ncbi:hypothetical protein GWO43_16180 [candidate division KSB1 bacterium]|nr:hypothetical protein [candidate division KSB1 bacterium]NIV68772.1 hypothetical protein [Phycisphaerae bacterium]NIS25489.1 hypothetical protein [candidate division KSB1 bacterium]NIT72382.1 hypothetical protein [candidate division KSB1 bacterium]NIU26166.1 hypothetical protein [candidate division KSB1 bacterium]
MDAASEKRIEGHRAEGFPSMPKSVAEAVVTVMDKLGTLGKDNKNSFDNYKYASIDDFLNFVHGKCASAGLFIIPQEAREPSLKETRTKDGKPLMQWHACFGFILGHKDGSLYGPIYKTVMVQANGAQAAGSAQSYALKQLMRGLFLIPTGDEDDPDTKGTAELTMSPEKTAESDFQAKANKIYQALGRAKNIDALIEIWEKNALFTEELNEADEGSLKKKAYTYLRNKFESRKKDLEQAD